MLSLPVAVPQLSQTQTKLSSKILELSSFEQVVFFLKSSKGVSSCQRTEKTFKNIFSTQLPLNAYFVFHFCPSCCWCVWECSRGELPTADHCPVVSVMAQLSAALIGCHLYPFNHNIFIHAIYEQLIHCLLLYNTVELSVIDSENIIWNLQTLSSLRVIPITTCYLLWAPQLHVPFIYMCLWIYWHRFCSCFISYVS